MTDPGLDQRLRQRSRRAGLMIGLSMALTIAVCVAGFSVIYAALDDTIGDFVSRDVPTAVVRNTEEPPEETIVAEQPEATEAPANDSVEPEPTASTESTAEPTTASDDGEFTPDYQTPFSDIQLRLRSEPSTAGGEATIIQLLDPGTPLEFTGQSQQSDNPAVDGADGWLFFRLEDGTEGWLRAIDVTELEN